jgi:hypothetical protein
MGIYYINRLIAAGPRPGIAEQPPPVRSPITAARGGDAFQKVD